MIVYLHGLNSSSGSIKARVLRDALAPVEVLAPDYSPHRPDAAVAALEDFMRGLPRCDRAPIVVGSSMGGFYGQYLSRRVPMRHLFMINPALRPWELFGRYADQPMVTPRGEHYTLSADIICAVRAYAVERPCNGGPSVPTTLLLDEGDEVIDYREAAGLYRGCGRVVTFRGGDHAFAHMPDAIALIREALSSSAAG